MTKDEILTQLQEAKTAHMQWLSNALALISGTTTDQDQVPVEHTECPFGKWYYGGGQRLASLGAYQAIERPHEHLHHTYAEIYQTLFARKTRPWLARLLTPRTQLKLSQSKQADEHIQRLVAASKRLLESIGLLEQAIMSAGEEELRALQPLR